MESNAGVIPNGLMAMVFNGGRITFTEDMPPNLHIDLEKKVWRMEDEPQKEFGQMCESSVRAGKGVICVLDTANVEHLNMLFGHFGRIMRIQDDKDFWKY